MHAPDGGTPLPLTGRVAGDAPSPCGKQPVITITNLVKRYGSFAAVDDVSFSIQEGEIFGIIGPNGAGKTTTVECISGLRVPDSGSISVCGMSPQRDRDNIKEFVGVQLQESRLPPRLKVGEALELFAAFYSNPLDPQELLASLGIKHIERAAFKNLSGGQKQTIIDLYIPTLMVISFIAIAISLPSTLVRDREIGWLRRISTTPAHPSRLLAAQLIFDLVLAAAAIVILIAGGTAIFGAPLTVDLPFFILSVALAIAEIFSLGLIVAALARTQTVASTVGGVLFFALLFLSGLWVQPLQISGPLREIMWYSPSGAAVRAILYSVFHATPPATTLLTLAGYTVVFAFVAVRYFRWE